MSRGFIGHIPAAIICLAILQRLALTDASAEFVSRLKMSAGTIDLTDDSPQQGGKREMAAPPAMPPKRLKTAPAGREKEAASGKVPKGDDRAASAGAAGAWVLVDGDDCGDNFADDAKWRNIVSASQLWEDPDFPAAKESIDGPPESEKAASKGSGEQRCRCGLVAKKSVVGKDTPNKGRPYFHCETRRCGFFNWADNRRSSWKQYHWERFSSFVIVSDFGFSAEHLRQGGVGDCWFLSALAVVAERHDLIAKLFKDTATNRAGCYNLRLFLDGQWQPVLIDDRLPCTKDPRRPEQVFDTGLAFSRASNAQLWVCLLEKAYAKAHGSYKAISGGHIAEALLDLTGAPCFTINFDEPHFNLDRLWTQLVFFKSKGFPMGCATGGGDPQLKEVGLCGSHAYSILECREIESKAASREIVRLLRIRNPHGVGEWNGDWSDASATWSQQLSHGLERTGVNDGTFWMDLTHFVMGFQLVDVCMAYRDWHARSFVNAFCPRACPSRVCRDLYRVRIHRETTLYVSVMQPTKRGAWCRTDRKKSYKLGDVSVLVVQLDNDGQFSRIAGGGLHADGSESRCSVVAHLDNPDAEYLVIPYSLGGPPSAAEVTKGQPFTVRLFASNTLRVLPEPFSSTDAPLTRAALQSAVITLGTGKVLPHEIGLRVTRRWQNFGQGRHACVLTCGGVVAVLGVNEDIADATFEVKANVKVMIARTAQVFSFMVFRM